MYNEWEDRWLSSMGLGGLRLRGLQPPTPGPRSSSFGFNQVRDAVFGDAEYACCGGERSDGSDDDSSDDDDEAEAEAAVAGA